MPKVKDAPRVEAEYATTPQLARLLGISKQSVLNMRDRGLLRPARINNRLLLYRISDVRAMLAGLEEGVADAAE
jgi:hypothetical protein